MEREEFANSKKWPQGVPLPHMNVPIDFKTHPRTNYNRGVYVGQVKIFGGVSLNDINFLGFRNAPFMYV